MTESKQSEQRSAVDALKDVNVKDTRSRRRWEATLGTVVLLGVAYSAYQLLHKATGLRIGSVEAWKARASPGRRR